MERDTEAQIVGEPMGGCPTIWSDPSDLALPASAEYAVYSAVFELEAATPTQLATRLGMRLTTFMDQLRLLESRGHARRTEHPTDGRSYRVVLTASGLEAHRGANRLFERANAAFVANLPDGEAAAKSALLAVQTAAESVLASLGVGATPRRLAGRAG